MTRIGDQRPQPAATIDGDSGGFALMPPGYAVFQAVAPLAKLVQEEGDVVHVLMTWLKAMALPNMLRMFVTAPVFQVLMS